MTFDFSHYFPYDWHEELRLFGLCSWIGFELDVEGGDYRITASWDALRAAGVSDRMINFLCESVGTHEGLNLRGASIILQTYAAGVCLAQGPRIFEPTEEQFEACEQIEMSGIQVEEYQQPYEVMIVRVPDGCRRRLSAETGLPLAECGHAVLVHRHPDGKVFAMVRFGVGMVPEYTNLFATSLKDPDPNMEAAILREQRGNAWRVTQPEAEYCNTVFRAALNLCLMLMHFGHRDGGPLDPTAFRKHRRKPELRRYAHADMQSVLMEQTIVVRELVGAIRGGEPGEPTGREVRPHWRRGHWRSQAHGPGRSLRKRVLIRPVLVRHDRLQDDVSGSVTFKGRNRP